MEKCSGETSKLRGKLKWWKRRRKPTWRLRMVDNSGESDSTPYPAPRMRHSFGQMNAGLRLIDASSVVPFPVRIFRPVNPENNRQIHQYRDEAGNSPQQQHNDSANANNNCNYLSEFSSSTENIEQKKKTNREV